MEKEYITSQKDIKKLVLELDNLKEDRNATLVQLNEAREKGDLSENADYDAAKKKLREIDETIRKIEYRIKNAKIITINDVNKDIVCVLAKVTLLAKNNNKMTYKLVSPEDSSIIDKKISTDSQLGKELLGKKVNDVIRYNANAGSLEFKILNISYEDL